MNSKLSVRKIEKHEIRILSYDGGLNMFLILLMRYGI